MHDCDDYVEDDEDDGDGNIGGGDDGHGMQLELFL